MVGVIRRIHTDLDKMIDDEWKRHNREISKVNITKHFADDIKKAINPVANINNYPFKGKLKVIRA